MKPRVTVITLGVNDLEKALHFYRDGLGLPTRGIIGREFEHGALALFDLQHGLKLAIFPRSDLAFDAKVCITDEAHDRPWGIYSGYFQDLDGHVWEVVWDPRFETEIID